MTKIFDISIPWDVVHRIRNWKISTHNPTVRKQWAFPVLGVVYVSKYIPAFYRLNTANIKGF